MKTRRKYKTIAGFLRAHSLRDAEHNSDAERNREREILNLLLPQLGIATIAATETPRDGVERLLKTTTDPRHIKALQDCKKWLGRKKWTITVGAVVPQVKTAQGLVTYRVHGFERSDHSRRVSVFVDAPEDSGEHFELAKKVAGPGYCLHASENCLKPIPDELKNKLASDEVLDTAIRALNPPTRQRRASR